ncbi:MAG: hypothetical protein HGA90_00770 [Alphaproteobacteria bacterium]|nr:hypothetical protein [Alphaproteobacteria bacterium]
MENKYLKPMLDTGSPRVFNCNAMTQKLQAVDPNAPMFFRNKQLNTIVLIKDTVPENERRKGGPSVGTKLYFPFNETNIYEGGRTIFLHDPHLQSAIIGHFGEGAVTKETLTEDLRLLALLDKLPSLDPFLLKDAFLREKIDVNTDYFEVSPEVWNEIETFMLQRFEPLVRAAFPDADSSDDKARQLIDKMWEARDLTALRPLVTAFRLPENEALDIFAAWKGIVYYSYQYQNEQGRFVNLVKWLKENEVAPAGATSTEVKEMRERQTLVRDQLRHEWQLIETTVRQYQESYDKMFKDKTSSSEFLSFLKNSNMTYWNLGNSFGKANHAIYCWDVMSARFKERKVPWQNFLDILRILSKVFEPEKKSATSVAWQ